jgi:hypothetical protein
VIKQSQTNPIKILLADKVRDMRKAWSLLIIIFCVIVANAHPSTAPSEARKFDEFGDVCCEDEKARLDNFANELQNNPEVQGYIVFYGGKRHKYPYCHSSRLMLPRRGEAEARAARLKPYISETRGIDPHRIMVVNGGYHDQWAAELWIVPKGANPPVPTPTVKPQEIRFRRGRIKRRDYECGV